MQAMKEWYQTHPHLFHKRPHDRPGCDSYPDVLISGGQEVESPRVLRRLQLLRRWSYEGVEQVLV